MKHFDNFEQEVISASCSIINQSETIFYDRIIFRPIKHLACET